ncbi:hypothetical protein IFM89_038871 [Coptis chinensis]|uniref:CRM domain-containing protein n=1 Tax=Coptis chinensis TaxID=261450 RepID=A0A835I6T9_9MAGN|nr:hypothetical protein IFM89_038871 [Coptis chinensis]
MAILATLPAKLFPSHPSKPQISEQPTSSKPPSPPISIPKYPHKPLIKKTAPQNPAFKSFHRKTKYYKPVSDGVISTDGDRSVVIGESGVSYLLPGAPFEFQYSYSETPKVKPLAIREPAFLPFSPPTMPRPWTGKAPLKKSKKNIQLFDSFNNGVKRVEMARTFPLGNFTKDGKTREEILGVPLTKAQVRMLIKPHMSHNRQVNLGRDGLTHNMLELIHSHWKRDEVCKIKCKGVPTVDMDNVCHHVEEKTGGKIIHRVGGVLYLFRGRNYNYRNRPQYPVMLWKPAAPVYPKLIQEAPEGLTKFEADNLRMKGESLLPICKLAKNGTYNNLVNNVRNAFEGSSLVKVNCQGMHATDYKKLGAKLKPLEATKIVHSCSNLNPESNFLPSSEHNNLGEEQRGRLENNDSQGDVLELGRRKRGDSKEFETEEEGEDRETEEEGDMKVDGGRAKFWWSLGYGQVESCAGSYLFQPGKNNDGKLLNTQLNVESSTNHVRGNGESQVSNEEGLATPTERRDLTTLAWDVGKAKSKPPSVGGASIAQHKTPVVGDDNKEKEGIYKAVMSCLERDNKRNQQVHHLPLQQKHPADQIYEGLVHPIQQANFEKVDFRIMEEGEALVIFQSEKDVERLIKMRHLQFGEGEIIFRCWNPEAGSINRNCLKSKEVWLSFTGVPFHLKTRNSYCTNKGLWYLALVCRELSELLQQEGLVGDLALLPKLRGYSFGAKQWKLMLYTVIWVLRKSKDNRIFRKEELVPCVLLSFDDEQILMWRGKDWKSIYPEAPSSESDIRPSSSRTPPDSDDLGALISLWKRALESSKALLLDEITLGPDALLEKVEEFEDKCQAKEHSYPALILSTEDNASPKTDCQNNFEFEIHDSNDENDPDVDENEEYDGDLLEGTESSVPCGSLPVDSLAEQLVWE